MGSSTAPAPAIPPPRDGSLAPPLPPKDKSMLEDPLVDLILTFQAVPTKHIKSKTKTSSDQRKETMDEFNTVLNRIRSLGLMVTTRLNKANDGKILIFVKAPEATVKKAVEAENVSDFLHGIPSPMVSQSSTPNRFSPATRARVVHSLLTLPPASSTTSSKQSNEDKDAGAAAKGHLHGAGLTFDGSKEFPNLLDVTPLHDESFNKSWLQRWSSLSSTLSLNVEELDSIRNQFGEHIAIYFGFLLFYFQSLAPIALLGFVFWALGLPYHAVYSLTLVIWSCFFVESWRMKERKLAVRWGTSGLDQVASRRAEFKPRIIRTDPVTGDVEEVFEWWRRELRSICAIPVMLFFAALLGATMTTMFAIEVFVTKLYVGPFSMIVPHIPTALFVIAVPQIMALWQATARNLTNWENHFSKNSHEKHLTLKMFSLQLVVAYGALTLSAFVYIPFGQNIMDHVVQRGFFQDSIQQAKENGQLTFKNDGTGINFEINPDRMHTQLFAVSVTSQIIGSFTELILPVILRRINQWRESKSTKKEGKVDEKKSLSTNADQLRESNFLKKVQHQLDLPPYDTFGDYAEMATQFGYSVLFSVVWPLAPTMAFINNFFELRSDAAKICINTRRPIPIRSEGVGPWLEVFGFIAWLGAMSNAALLYLFQRSAEASLPGHSSYEVTMRSHLHSPVNSTTTASTSSPTEFQPQSAFSFSHVLPSFLPTSGPSGALVAAALSALASEHAYGVFRAGVRHLLERLVWRGSTEEIELRKGEWEKRKLAAKVALKGDLINESNPVAVEVAEINNGSQLDLDERKNGFWNSENNVGVEIIENSGKTE